MLHMSSLETLELMEHTFPDVGDVNSIRVTESLVYYVYLHLKGLNAVALMT